jgi:hypothetical protein
MQHLSDFPFKCPQGVDDLRARNPERLEIYDVCRATFVRDARAPTCCVDVLGKETAAKLSNDLQDAPSVLPA